jgi:hypothetical protein
MRLEVGAVTEPVAVARSVVVIVPTSEGVADASEKDPLRVRTVLEREAVLETDTV